MSMSEYELRYLRAGVESLENYLLSEELYWPIGVSAPPGARPYPRLTLGGLLLSQKKAHAQTLTPEQRTELARLDERVDTARARWRVAWGNKSSRGFSARLRMWRDFLEEYRADPGDNYDRFAYEVRQRVMLHLLETGVREADEDQRVERAEFEMLDGLDQLLQAVFVPGEFIWDPGLASSFLPQPYWYLYGELKK